LDYNSGAVGTHGLNAVGHISEVEKARQQPIKRKMLRELKY